MVEVGDRAPSFTVPIAGGEAYNDVDEFTLSEALGEGPVVLAFVPAAFTGWCSSELATFADGFEAFEAVDARVYGVSVDLPFAQNVWADELGLPFPLLSDPDHEVIEAYGVVWEGLYDVVTAAERSVFVIGRDGVVTYKWVEPGGGSPTGRRWSTRSRTPPRRLPPRRSRPGRSGGLGRRRAATTAPV